MRNRIIGIGAAVGLTMLAGYAALAEGHELPPRPMEEMHGDCMNYRWDMSRELAMWEATAQSVAAAASAEAPPTVELSTRYAVSLVPHDDVVFVVTPEKDRGGSDRFSGILRVTVPEDGLYRVSASSGIWIDAVSNGEVIKSSGFEMQTKCSTVFKSVAYRLSKGDSTVLQLSGNRTSAVDIAITAVSTN